MIVHVFAGDWYEVADDLHEEFNTLDNAIVDAVEAGDAAAFRERFDAFLKYIDDHGTKLDDDFLGGADVDVPPADIDFDEAPQYFSGEGLIPDSYFPGSE